jgi:hypothetical protein
MADAQAKLKKLEDAGILDRKHFSDEEMALIDKIDDDEVAVLIRLRQKLGPTAEGKNHIRPNFIV